MKSIVISLILGIIIGITATQIHSWYYTPPIEYTPNLRLGRDNLINPLLACNNLQTPVTSPLIKKLESQLQDLVSQHISQGHITNAGIHLHINTANYLTINPDEKFYPASLNKIPIMITAYKTAQSNPDFLKQTITFTDKIDYNQNQEIVPQDTIQPGQTYTIEDAVTKMITDSDNNGFYALTQHLDPALYSATYEDLQIPLIRDTQTIADYITPENFSYFFRVLYNATYLNNDYSQKALELLTQVKYNGGLRANIPQEIAIAHKFGLLTNSVDGQVINRELHDCGRIYHPQSPYLLCIMTKSTAPLDQIEQFIQEASQTIYDQITQS